MILLPDVRVHLIQLALAMRERAYCPYSGYRVGAALLAEDGVAYSGCNVVRFGATIVISKRPSFGHIAPVALCARAMLTSCTYNQSGLICMLSLLLTAILHYYGTTYYYGTALLLILRYYLLLYCWYYKFSAACGGGKVIICLAF
jgi:hypothetical protein